MTFQGVSAFMTYIDELVREEEEAKCSTCEGTGEVEIMEHDCSDLTGYNTVVMGTGKFETCPDCDGSGLWTSKK